METVKNLFLKVGGNELCSKMHEWECPECKIHEMSQYQHTCAQPEFNLLQARVKYGLETMDRASLYTFFGNLVQDRIDVTPWDVVKFFATYPSPEIALIHYRLDWRQEVTRLAIEEYMGQPIDEMDSEDSEEGEVPSDLED